MERKAPPQDFAGRVAVVTGAARGIGRAIAENLGGRGAHLILVDRDAAGMASLSANLSAAACIEVDLSSAREVEELLLKVVRLTPKVDVLVNNAGIEKDLPLEEVTAQFFDQIMATNLRAPFLLSQGLVPLFSEVGGAIVNISSIHASHAFPHAIPYACSKAGLLALTRNLALELAGRKIRVNAVLPGYIDTAMWDQWLRTVSNPEEEWVTGTHLVVDGGLTIRAHP
jgi:NAD(P)-dependent dehydrogenase (short-subunit alcohol dehydrogenase family)